MTILALMTTNKDDWGGIAWRPGIGDPNFFGWFTVAGYALAALLCYAAWKSERRRPMPAKPRFWFALTVALVLLGINKQLDIQTLFTEVGRIVLRHQGWLNQKREFQLAFIAAVAAAALLLVLALAWWLRGLWRRCGVALVGFDLLAAFVVIRAASFHHIDQFLGQQVWILKVNHILELGALALVCAGAGWALKSR